MQEQDARLFVSHVLPPSLVGIHPYMLHVRDACVFGN
jgi:hypothetical protein